MDSSRDNFETLQKLLRLKRYEQPPPRYFNEFSGNVIAKIRAGAARPRWWERFGFDLRPVLSLGAGALACGVLVAAGLGNDGESGQAAMPMAGVGGVDAFTAATASPVDSFVSATSESSASTNPVINRAGVMLDGLRRSVRPVSYMH